MWSHPSLYSNVQTAKAIASLSHTGLVNVIRAIDASAGKIS